MPVKTRNIAIIAHVDHGKTTLIDGLFKQSGLFKSHKVVDERVMDSNELEKERGITIRAKNASFIWKDTRINIVDTPGHADFGGEVERALFMVNGAMLLVDAAEGPLPQTRFVLEKALQRGIKICVVINKVDRPDARVVEIEEKVLELFYELAADDSQVEFKTIYASAKEGWATLSLDDPRENLFPLLDLIANEMPDPIVADGPFQMLVANISYNSFVGQVAVGRIHSGEVKANQRLHIIGKNDKPVAFNVNSLECYSGLTTDKVDVLKAGDIALIAGSLNPKIGDTICSTEINKALPRLTVDPPTVSVRISVNTSPTAGQDGTYVTSRKIEELLQKACLNNVALQYSPTDNPELFTLKARGELQIVVLLEELRRLGNELMIGRPEVIAQEVEGMLYEPTESFVIDTPQDYVGVITELLSTRNGRMINMENLEASNRTRIEFHIPTRGLIGIRSHLMTLTRGEAIFASSIIGKIEYQGKRFSRKNGAIISDRSGISTRYAINNLQSRGKMFIKEGMTIYEGMVFGENSKREDLNGNPCKEKKLTNIRTANKDEAARLVPIQDMSLEEALEWIDEDEWIEMTPKRIRLRKHELRTNFRKVTRHDGL